MRRGWWAVMLSVCILGPGVIADTTVPAQEGAEENRETESYSGPANASPEQRTATLHAYANLIQIPVLVLGSERETIAPVDTSRFRLSIDGGPQYKVTHARIEGDDPISLAILLDVRGPEDNLMQKMDAAIAGLAPLSLGVRDHVTIFALGCSLESSERVIADRAALEGDVDALLRESMSRRREKRKGDCSDGWRLWDALEVAVEKLSAAPGLRVILAVTNGEDRGSHYKWKQVTELAESKGVTVFGLAGGRVYPGHFYYMQSYDDLGLLDRLCQLSGGLVMTANSDNLAQQLAQFVKLVRGRYIVEFPRPYNSTVGRHTLAFTLEKSDAFVRSAGILVPMADPELMADPMTVPSDPSRTPQQGKRTSQHP